MTDSKKIQIIIENTFVHQAAPESNQNISVYNRVFNKLVNEGGSLGKVHPIYLTIDSIQRIIAVFTLNRGGTSSLFFELPGEISFDHITFVKDLHKNNHHLTGVNERGREKLLPLNTKLLSNNTYYALTVLVGDINFLKEVPKQIFYPEVDVHHLKKLEDAFLTSGTLKGSSNIQVGKGKGLLCLQIFLIPREVDYKAMNFFINPLKSYIPKIDLNLENGSPESNLIILHEHQNDYVIGVKTIFLKKHFNKRLLALSFPSQVNYSKINIKQQNKGT